LKLKAGVAFTKQKIVSHFQRLFTNKDLCQSNIVFAYSKASRILTFAKQN